MKAKHYFDPNSKAIKSLLKLNKKKDFVTLEKEIEKPEKIEDNISGPRWDGDIFRIISPLDEGPEQKEGPEEQEEQEKEISIKEPSLY